MIRSVRHTADAIATMTPMDLGVARNSQRGEETAVLVDLSASNASDPGQLERATVAVEREFLGIAPGDVVGFEPFIRYDTLQASGNDFTVVPRMLDRDSIVRDFR